jgi:3-phosphoshikimate 1-carboxyvinyltransferase
LILAALAQGSSTVRNLNRGQDVQATAHAAAQFGAAVDLDEDNGRAEVESAGMGGLTEPRDVVWAGNSGTTLRCLLGVASGVQGLTVMTGDESLRARPMLRVVAPLRQMGADIDGREFGARAPLTVRGSRLQGIDFAMKVASAQVQTAILLAGLAADGETSVSAPGPLRDHTERMLAAAGVEVRRDDKTVSVVGGRAPDPIEWRVPGDFSSAAFLIAGATLLEGSELTIEDVGINPTRTGMLDAVRRMGAEIEVEETDVWTGEPVGLVRVRASSLRATEIGGDEVPRLIDELPVLAVLATQAEGTTTFRDAAELRVKESDRIETVAQALTTLGADVETTTDGLIVRGPTPLSGGEVDAHNDHRVALAMAVAGFIAQNTVRVLGWSAVDTSFPEFLDVVAEARSGKS